MHILLISRCPPWPLYLGDRLILYHLARELHRRGHTLDLLAFDERPALGAGSPEHRAHYAHFFQHIEILPEPPRTPSMYLRRLLSLNFFPVLAAQAWSPPMFRAVEARIAEHPPDVVHVLGGVQVYEYAELIFNPYEREDTPGVVQLPGLITPYESFSLFLERALREAGGVEKLATFARLLLARAYERGMFDHAAFGRVVVLTEADAAALRRLNRHLPLEIIPNGIDEAYFVPMNVPRETHTLVFTGNYEYTPNADAALRLAREVFPRVRARFPDAKLWLVGNAPTPQMQAAANEADDAITVTGRVDDLRPFLARASVFVSPLTVGAGIKNKVLEAMAMDCPVAGTPITLDGISDNDGEYARIVSPEQLADIAINLLEHPAEAAHMAERARALIAARFKWGAVAGKYEALYRDIQLP